MDETTRRVLADLKALTDTRKQMQEQGLLTPFELRRKMLIEEQMKLEIRACMQITQNRINAKKREEEKVIGQMTYKLERKIREMNRLREEEEYRQQVEERYEAKMKKEKEAEEGRKKKENGHINGEKKDDSEMEKDERKIETTNAQTQKEARKTYKRGSNNERKEDENNKINELNIQSLSL